MKKIILRQGQWLSGKAMPYNDENTRESLGLASQGLPVHAECA